MQIVIEKGVPLPETAPGRSNKGPIRLAMEAMEVGDSFISPFKDRRMSGQISAVSKEHGYKFATRTVDGKIRVWRIK